MAATKKSLKGPEAKRKKKISSTKRKTTQKIEEARREIRTLKDGIKKEETQKRKRGR